MNNHSANRAADTLNGIVRHLHCIPVGDLDVHSAQRVCWCHPTEIVSCLWAHNAKDCREAKERFTEGKASEGWIVIAEFIFHPDSTREAGLTYEAVREIERKCGAEEISHSRMIEMLRELACDVAVKLSNMTVQRRETAEKKKQ